MPNMQHGVSHQGFDRRQVQGALSITSRQASDSLPKSDCSAVFNSASVPLRIVYVSSNLCVPSRGCVLCVLHDCDHPLAAPRVGQLFRNSNVYQMSIVVKVGCSETRSSSDNISRRRCSSSGMGWPDVTRCCACRPVCSCAHVDGMSIVLVVRLLGIVLAQSFVKSEIKSVR